MRLLRRWKKLYVGSLTVIYFAFFTAQLSYKFHLCANFPIFTTAHDKDSVQSSVISDESGEPYFDSRLLLSIDKRYELLHPFALITPEYRIARKNLVSHTACYSYSPHHPSPVTAWLSLRGPPSV